MIYNSEPTKILVILRVVRSLFLSLITHFLTVQVLRKSLHLGEQLMHIFLRYLVIVVCVVVLVTLATGTVLAEMASGITSPSPNAVVAGSAVIRGVAVHPELRKWQLDLLLSGDSEEATFLVFGEKAIDIEADLITWDTTRYPDGDHVLRLRVVHSDLNYDEYFLPITIKNDRSVNSVTPKSASSLWQQPTSSNSEPSGISNAVRWIDIDISDQRLVAWEDDVKILETAISTGRAEFPTVAGVFNVRTKFRSTRMRGIGYDTADVPWVMYFYDNYAIHGAYWHNDFGVPVSHGCVNLPVNDAKRLFEWAKVGIEVRVHQ
ncbi:MAG: L,D-transpeptidase [Caldilineaceae bacterium]|nr:L,D-transpeptidase [Caldilineaceae bacterium]MBP8106326.1 L,D-transpeptidase [Caldilineaceae bacterium]MBP9071118.1 L,D-transpeptidase [Caldilineaceae bacterium]